MTAALLKQNFTNVIYLMGISVNPNKNLHFYAHQYFGICIAYLCLIEFSLMDSYQVLNAIEIVSSLVTYRKKD